MSDDLIAKMRERAATCRRLADATYDRNLSATLLNMAEQIDADLNEFEDEATPQLPNPPQSA